MHHTNTVRRFIIAGGWPASSFYELVEGRPVLWFRLSTNQRLTAEGKLGEAGQKLEELKRAIEKLNTRQR
jgi:hypothetical protein